MTVNDTTVVFRRIYADLAGTTDAKLEALAKANGRTKKGQIEFLINEAVKEYDAKEAETNKRSKKGAR